MRVMGSWGHGGHGGHEGHSGNFEVLGVILVRNNFIGVNVDICRFIIRQISELTSKKFAISRITLKTSKFLK